MSTLICNPGRDCINSLGIPVDSLTLESAVERIIAMAEARDGRARLVSTLNVDFLVNSLGTAFSRPRHPELLEVLRASDLVTADGFPIVWLSRLMGRPLPGRVCGSDMVPAIAARAARDGLSLFLLGGGEGAAAEAASTLQQQNPGLRIAGTAAPMVRTAGPGLAAAAEDDEALLQIINESGADILLVGLGNPKQELWFNRNRSGLRTPVSIGVGGTFEFVTGRVSRAPKRWQQLNLEWLFRLSQDPGRLWKRYGKGLFKMALLAAPVLTARAAESLTALSRSASSEPIRWRHLWSSREDSISLLSLPRRLEGDSLPRINHDRVTRTGGDGRHSLDCSQVRRVTLSCQQEMFHLAALLRQYPGKLQLMGMSAAMRRQLRGARLLDLLEVGSNTKGALNSLSAGPQAGAPFRCRSYMLRDEALFMISGRVNRDNLAAIGFTECLLHSARDRRCIIDLRDVELLESSGIAELMPLFQPRDGYAGDVLLSGTGYSVKQMLKMAELDYDARFISDQALLAIINGGTQP